MQRVSERQIEKQAERKIRHLAHMDSF
jgi:hypothetical protein